MRAFIRFFAGGQDISHELPDDAECRLAICGGVLCRLIYAGGGISANRALIEWVRAQAFQFDRWNTEKGDNFCGRCETHLTDLRVEPRKS